MRLPQQHVKSIVGFLLHSSLLLLSFIETSAQQVVFTAGEKGYASFRIPAIVKAPNGDLLAICEGRVRHAGDFGNIDLVMKRSSDNGKTWSTWLLIDHQPDLRAGDTRKDYTAYSDLVLVNKKELVYCMKEIIIAK
jgi:Neuraminidase (sialidase)